jgi:hypothetical protein
VSPSFGKQYMFFKNYSSPGPIQFKAKDRCSFTELRAADMLKREPLHRCRPPAAASSAAAGTGMMRARAFRQGRRRKTIE